MQDRYAGDIGDFGKLGLLRALRKEGLSVGVNWYLVPDEKHNGDGRHIHYLSKAAYRLCDEELWRSLNLIVASGQRSVAALEKEKILQASFFSKPLAFQGRPRPERERMRESWHREALASLAGVDIVFVDPDNGLMVSSAVGTTKENKYVTVRELADYYAQGSSVIYYQHKARVGDEFYIDQHRRLLEYNAIKGASGLGLKFMPTSQRYFFFMVQQKHRSIVLNGVQEMLTTDWKNCFRLLPDTI